MASSILKNILIFVVLTALSGVRTGFAAGDPAAGDALEFDDRPLTEPLRYPDWFKLSFLDLQADLREAVADGKTGLVVYIGQKFCPYCKALLENDFGKPDIVTYTRTHFDVVGIDIHGGQTVTDVDGVDTTERGFADRHAINFTPTLLFFDARGEVALRLDGYYPPYKFRAALEYVAGGHYQRESLHDYLARADAAFHFSEGEMNQEDFFLPGPYHLDRSRQRGEHPLLVFFEQPDCHACDILHAGPLREPEVLARLKRLEAVQLDIWADTPVVTPAGKRTTARDWAKALGLFYTPTLVFYDAAGKEILRVDSVVQFYRLREVVDYVLTGAYREFPTLQRWRQSQQGAVPNRSAD